MSFVGGWPFIVAAFGNGLFYYQVAKVYSRTARDMRRLGMSHFTTLFRTLLILIRFGGERPPLICLFSTTLSDKDHVSIIFYVLRNCIRNLGSSCVWGILQNSQRHAALRRYCS
jgi:hypothetical protein